MKESKVNVIFEILSSEKNISPQKVKVYQVFVLLLQGTECTSSLSGLALERLGGGDLPPIFDKLMCSGHLGWSDGRLKKHAQAISGL